MKTQIDGKWYKTKPDPYGSVTLGCAKCAAGAGGGLPGGDSLCDKLYSAAGGCGVEGVYWKEIKVEPEDTGPLSPGQLMLYRDHEKEFLVMVTEQQEPDTDRFTGIVIAAKTFDDTDQPTWEIGGRSSAWGTDSPQWTRLSPKRSAKLLNSLMKRS